MKRILALAFSALLPICAFAAQEFGAGGGGGGGGTPGGSNTNVQFNNAGSFGGVGSFTWTSPTLTVPIIKASSTTFNSNNYFWPTLQGGASTFLQNDGSGNLIWASAGGGGTPGGTSGQAQFNNSGSFGGFGNWNGSNTFSVPIIKADTTTLNAVTYNWPVAQGNPTSCLQNDGSGNLSWLNCVQGSTPTFNSGILVAPSDTGNFQSCIAGSTVTFNLAFPQPVRIDVAGTNVIENTSANGWDVLIDGSFVDNFGPAYHMADSGTGLATAGITRTVSLPNYITQHLYTAGSHNACLYATIGGSVNSTRCQEGPCYFQVSSSSGTGGSGSGGGYFTLDSQGSVTNGSTLTVSLANTTFKHWKGTFWGAPSTTSNITSMQLRLNGDSTAGDYFNQFNITSSASLHSATDTANTFPFASTTEPMCGNAANTGFMYNIDLVNNADTGQATVTVVGSFRSCDGNNNTEAVYQGSVLYIPGQASSLSIVTDQNMTSHISFAGAQN